MRHSAILASVAALLGLVPPTSASGLHAIWPMLGAHSVDGPLPPQLNQRRNDKVGVTNAMRRYGVRYAQHYSLKTGHPKINSLKPRGGRRV